MKYTDRFRGNADNQYAERVAWFGVGALAGAGIALLLAPKPGRELRQDIADGTSQAVDRVRDAGATVGDQARHLAERATGSNGKSKKRKKARIMAR